MSRRRDYSSLIEAIEQGEGVERPFVCHEHADTNASASVNVEKGVWHCFVCHASGRADRKGRTYNGEMKLALAAFDTGPQVAPKPMRWLDVFDAVRTHEYWEERFGLETCRHHRLGIHPVTGNPTYPLIGPDKKVYGVVQRTFGQPKYIYPKGVSVSQMLYGFSKRPVNKVIVVEGACDAIAVQTAIQGTRLGEGAMVVASYGAGLHLPQVALINSLRPSVVGLGFDNDNAGRIANGRYYPFEAPVVEQISWAAKDPGECSAIQIRRAIRGAQRSSGEGRNEQSG